VGASRWESLIRSAAKRPQQAGKGAAAAPTQGPTVAQNSRLGVPLKEEEKEASKPACRDNCSPFPQF